ncbi:MAG: GNAT family N-acetyltransferase [Muribaculum sp.]|nr:GNAT family N-acetyltransferase [Muribaculum sp.]
MELTFKRETFVDDNGLVKLVELQNEVYKGKHTFKIDDYKFWYVDNPQGLAYSFSAYDGDMMVANYSCIPTTLSVFGQVLHGIHSMGVVTHQSYQGLGLFSKLAEMTNQCAKDEGKDFVMALSNANSTPGFIKKLGFSLIAPLEVKWGWGDIRCDLSHINVHKVYDAETLNWRLRDPKYSKSKDVIYGIHSINFGIKTFMGIIGDELINQVRIQESRNLIRPLNLYIGLGADLSHGHYYDFPKFVKHSPFNLIFKNLRDDLEINFKKEDVLIQLLDFDVT